MQLDQGQDRVGDLGIGENMMPKWVRYFLRAYAVVLLATLCYATFKLVLIIFSHISNFSDFFSFAPLPFLLIGGGIALPVLTIMVSFIYSIGVFRLKRWVLPILLFYTTSTIIIDVLRLVNGGYTTSVDFTWTGVLIINLALVSVAWIYRRGFPGPMRKLSLQIPILLVFIPVVIFSLLSQVYTDDPTINDSDLLLSNIEVLAKTDNAHFALPVVSDLSTSEQNAFADASELYSALEKGEDINTDKASADLDILGNVTSGFIKASKKPGYQCPSLVNVYSIDAVLCGLQDVRSMAKIIAVKSYVEAQEGHIDVALDTAMAPARFAKLMDSGQPLLIEHLVANALVGISIDSIGRILDHTTISESLSSDIRRELGTYKLDGSSLVIVLKREYMMHKMAMGTFRSFEGYIFHYHETVNDIAKSLRKSLEVVDQSCDSKSENSNGNAGGVEETPTWWTAIKPNGVGRILIQTLIGPFATDTIHLKECELNQRITETQQRLLGQTPSPETAR